MKKQLQELLEIAKNGSKEDVLAYLPNLEVNYFSDRADKLDNAIISCYDEIQNYLDTHKNQDWEDDLQDDLIYLIELIICDEENGLLIDDEGGDGYLAWRDFSISSEYFFENKEVEAITTIDLDSYLEKVKAGELIVTTSPFSDSYYIFEDGEWIDWDHKPENSLRIADHWNFISKNELHAKVHDYNQPVNQLMIGIYDLGRYNVTEIDEAKIKVFINKIQEYVNYDY